MALDPNPNPNLNLRRQPGEGYDRACEARQLEHVQIGAATAAVYAIVQQLDLSWWPTHRIRVLSLASAHGHGAHHHQSKPGCMAAKALEQARTARDTCVAVLRVRGSIRLEVEEERALFAVGQEATKTIGRAVEASIVVVTGGGVVVYKYVRLGGRAVPSMKTAPPPWLPPSPRADGAALKTASVQQRRATICEHIRRYVHVAMDPVKRQRVPAQAG